MTYQKLSPVGYATKVLQLLCFSSHFPRPELVVVNETLQQIFARKNTKKGCVCVECDVCIKGVGAPTSGRVNPTTHHALFPENTQHFFQVFLFTLGSQQLIE